MHDVRPAAKDRTCAFYNDFASTNSIAESLLFLLFCLTNFAIQLVVLAGTWLWSVMFADRLTSRCCADGV